MNVIVSPNAPKAIGPYSQAMVSMVCCIFPGRLVSIRRRVNSRKVLKPRRNRLSKNIAAILEAAGSDFSKVVKTTCFLYDMKDFAAFNAIYEKTFISKPARSCVAVKELPAHFLCEIEVIAEV